MARRTDQRTDKAAALGAALKGMFKKLERRPAPDHIMTVVDQLDAAAPPVKKAESA